MKTITKSVIKLSEIPEHLQSSEVFDGHKIHTYAEFHIDDSKKDELTLWLIEKYPTIKMKVSFLIHIDMEKQKQENDYTALLKPIGNRQTAVHRLIEKHFGSIENCTPNFSNKINQAKEMEKQQQGYSEEEVKRLAFKFYLEMSKQMNVPDNLITENYTNVDEWFKQLNQIKHK